MLDKKKYKAIIIGFGKVANSIRYDKKMKKYFRFSSHSQVLSYHPNLIWLAVVDPNIDALNSAKEEWNVPVAVKTIDDLPVNLEPEILILATRSNYRLEAIKKFKNLKGLIIEKPLSNDVNERNEIIDYCQKNNLKVNVNLFRRVDELSLQYSKKEFLDNVGEIQLGTIIYGNGIWNNGIHFIDQIRMLGAKIEAVQALGNIKNNNLSTVDNDFNSNVLLYLNNEAKIFMHPINFEYYRDQVIDIWGTKGKLQIFQEGLFFKLHSTKSHRAIENFAELTLDKSIVSLSSIGTALYDLYDDLLFAIDNNSKTKSTLVNAKKNEEIIDAILQSSKSNNKKIIIH